MSYTVPTAERALRLLETLAQLEQQPRAQADKREIARIRREILRLTGAPSTPAAAAGVRAFLAAHARIVEARASGKPKKMAAALEPTRKARKPPRTGPLNHPQPITVVQGGLPETRR